MEDENKIERENNNPNEIVEVDTNEEVSNTQYDITGVTEAVVENKKKKKKKKVSKWSKLSKKKKIIICVIIGVVLLIIIGLLLYFLVFKKDNDDLNSEPLVIVEKDNYIYKSGVLVFIDEDKNEIGSYECKNKDENLCYVAYYSNEDDFDVAKKIYEDGTSIKIRSDIILDRYVFVYDDSKKENGNIILYDIKEEKDLNTYSLVKEGINDSIIVSEDDKYGLLVFDDEYKEQITFKYDYMGYIDDSKYLVVANNGNYKLIDEDGEDVSKNVPGKIKNFGTKAISVKVGSDYFVYGYDGNKIIDTDYDYISFVGDYIIVINGKNLNIIDATGAAMNGEAIRLSSNSYNTKLIFNEDLRQTNKEEAFNSYVNGKTLKIELEDETVSINLNEGIFNKTLEYINYFAGKLYIYSDAEKTKLIGSYQCSYANSVNDGTSSLDNCYIAKESNLFKIDDTTVVNSYLPIYNNRYVFIADTKAPSTNDNIVMYDLKTSKTLATYKMIDTGYHTENNGVTFVDTAGTIALAFSIKNSSYGLINILNSSVDTLISFLDKDTNLTNKEFKMVGDYILFKKSDDSYHLYTNKGSEITKNITTMDEIVAYKGGAVMIKTVNGTYMLYRISDGKLITSECKYLKMEDKFYVSVDTYNVLGVYKYDDTTNLLPDVVIDSNTDVKYAISGKSVVISYTADGATNSKTIVIEE